ncbi:MAG: ribonuclease P protein component [Anaerolineales bacterium]|nr:ribonuclease P protein component [Chloroflexota bacterium]MBL6980996.1 ribonuclease P protein component [Anaerolineales bacterium]
MKRTLRLTSATDFKRVRRHGKSFAHPLVVLIVLPNDLKISRFGVSAGRSVGNAVQRNRAKRQLREIIRPLTSAIPPGWDIVLLARSGCAKTQFHEIKAATTELLIKAQLFQE